MNDIDHTRGRIKRPQTNGTCERFQKTVLNESTASCFAHAFVTLDEPQRAFDAWITEYNDAGIRLLRRSDGGRYESVFAKDRRVGRRADDSPGARAQRAILPLESPRADYEPKENCWDNAAAESFFSSLKVFQQLKERADKETNL